MGHDNVLDHRITVVENTLIKQQEKIDENVKKSYQSDAEIKSINNEIKSINDELKKINEKLDLLTNIENRIVKIEDIKAEDRIKKLEEIHKKRQWNYNLLTSILSFIQRYWGVILLICIALFYFDVKIEVNNPHVMEFIQSYFKSKL